MNREEKLTMTIVEAADALGISRATAYMLARSGQLPTIRLGERRLVVPKIALDKMLNGDGKPRE